MSWCLSSSLGKTCRLLFDRDLPEGKYKLTSCVIVINIMYSDWIINLIILSANDHILYNLYVQKPVNKMVQPCSMMIRTGVLETSGL